MKQPADIFIDVLRETREARGITVEQLAERTGIPAHSIARWERGGQKPRLQSAFKVAAVLGLRLELAAN
jgi:transcriptional regulator with XRE-family HTH domain